jgi:hypothetical protein
MKIRLVTIYDCPHLEFVEYVQLTESFRFITWPILTFQPERGAWPERWQMGRDMFHLRLFGVVPMGSQQINISNPSLGIASDGSVMLRDDGHGTLMQHWDHWITVKPHKINQTYYVDEIEVSARFLAPLLTPLCRLFAFLFYAHRQRRWKKFIKHKKDFL